MILKILLKKKHQSILNLCLLFPNIVSKDVLQDIDLEFREILELDFKEMFRDSLLNVKIQDFWKCILEKKTG